MIRLNEKFTFHAQLNRTVCAQVRRVIRRFADPMQTDRSDVDRAQSETYIYAIASHQRRGGARRSLIGSSLESRKLSIPDKAARTLLAVIAYDHKAVERALLAAAG